MPHFTIQGVDFPFVSRFDFLYQDWVIVREVTGLAAREFVILEQLGEGDELDPSVLYGYAIVAFWHGNREMSRTRVTAAVEDWGYDDVDFTPDAHDVEADAVPLDLAEDGTASNEAPSSTSPESKPGEDEPSERTTLSVGGQRGSPTGSPA